MTKILKPKTEKQLKRTINKYKRMGYHNLSGGGMELMKMDMRLYKGVKAVIIKHLTEYYTYWVNYKSFKKHGHRYL